MIVIFFTTLGTLMLMIINNRTDGTSVLNYLFHIIITFSTVGYTEGYGTENLDLNRVFSTLFIIITIPVVYMYGLVSIVNVFMNHNINQIYRYWKMYKEMEKLKEHYIVCGFNGITKELIQVLKKRGRSFVLIEPDISKREEIENSGIKYFVFDEPFKRSVLLGVGIERAAGLITAFEENTQDIAIIVTARLIRPDREDFYICATATTEGSAEKMQLLGANDVIVPNITMGRRIASFILHKRTPVVSKFLEKIAYGEKTDIDLIEVKIDENTDFVGKELKEIKLPQKTGATVVAIIKEDGSMKISPSGETKVSVGDYLIVLGHPKALRKVEKFVEQHRKVNI